MQEAPMNILLLNDSIPKTLELSHLLYIVCLLTYHKYQKNNHCKQKIHNLPLRKYRTLNIKKVLVINSKRYTCLAFRKFINIIVISHKWALP